MSLRTTAFFTDPRLVSYWEFESDGADSIGTNGLTAASDPAYGTGKFGNGVTLDSDDTLTKSSATFLTDADGTLCGWLKKGATGQGPVLWSLSDSGNEFGNAIYSEHRGDTSDKITFFHTDASATVFGATTDTTFDDTNWHHIAYTSSGSTLKIYIDGTESALTVSAGSNTGQWFDNVSSPDFFKFQAGADATGHSLDDWAFFNDDLTAQEIADIYNDVPLATGGGMPVFFY